MARTTPTLVQDILGAHYNGTSSLDTYITTAAALVDWLVTQDSQGELNAALLAEIERYLAAHFYEHEDQITQTRSTGGASGSFQGATAMILLGTKYGQTACLLDVTGKLAKRSKEAETGTRRVASVAWLGLPPSEQTAVENRD